MERPVLDSKGQPIVSEAMKAAHGLLFPRFYSLLPAVAMGNPALSADEIVTKSLDIALEACHRIGIHFNGIDPAIGFVDDEPESSDQ